jgi:hypothetical protein
MLPGVRGMLDAPRLGEQPRFRLPRRGRYLEEHATAGPLGSVISAKQFVNEGSRGRNDFAA